MNKYLIKVKLMQKLTELNWMFFIHDQKNNLKPETEKQRVILGKIKRVSQSTKAQKKKKILKKEGKRETDKRQNVMLKTSSMKNFCYPHRPHKYITPLNRNLYSPFW